MASIEILTPEVIALLRPARFVDVEATYLAELQAKASAYDAIKRAIGGALDLDSLVAEIKNDAH